MNKHLISAGHVRINPYLLEEVLKDNPKCTGNRELIKCTYAHAECTKNCYKTEQESCPTYRYLRQVKSYEDKFGVVRR